MNACQETDQYYRLTIKCIKMKKHLFIQLALMLTVTFAYYSCKKSDNPSPAPKPTPQPVNTYYIKAKLNGELTSYNMNTKGIIEGKQFQAYAYSGSAFNYPMFSMQIEEDNDAITTKTYFEGNSSTNLIFRYLRKDDSGVFYSQLGEEMDFKINFTEIKSDYIKGTFGGTIRYSENPDQSITVSEGEFIVPR